MTKRKFSRFEGGVLLAAALCLGVLCFGWRAWRHDVGPAATGELSRASGPLASGTSRLPSSEIGPAPPSPTREQRLLKIKEAGRFWSDKETEILRALREELPAALARRKAAAPYFHAIVAYGTDIQTRLYAKHKGTRQRLNAAGMPDEKTAANIAKIHALEHCLSRYEVLGDSTVLAGDRTFGEIAYELNGASGLRRAMIEVEQKVFGEEAATRHLELTSDENVLAEMQAAIPRYQAAKQQITGASSLDAAHAEFLHDFDYGNEAWSISAQYKDRHNHEISELLEKCYYPQRVIQSLVGGAQEDDDESRRLLTIVADLYQQTRRAEDAAD